MAEQEGAICPNGEHCIDINPVHFLEFSHPHLDENSDDEKSVDENADDKKSDDENLNITKWQRYYQSCINSIRSVNHVKGTMAEKLSNAAPYNLFLTTIMKCPEALKDPLCVTFLEILDISLGEIESSCLFSNVTSCTWIFYNYYLANIIDKPVTVISERICRLEKLQQFFPQGIISQTQIGNGLHDSRMMLFYYKDQSMRIVISGSNVTRFDWVHYINGVWISPRLPSLEESVKLIKSGISGESATQFRHDFVVYLKEYKLTELDIWLERIQRTDFSSINVFFCGSVPGRWRDNDPSMSMWGHPRIRDLLREHCSAKIDARDPLICQGNAIGFYGEDINQWLGRELLDSLKHFKGYRKDQRLPDFKLIFPTEKNFHNSLTKKYHSYPYLFFKKYFYVIQYYWLKYCMFQWSFEDRHLTKALPRNKSYTRLNLKDMCVYWSILTSCNPARSSWGQYLQTGGVTTFAIKNFEAGILFLPQFVLGEETFPLGENRSNGSPKFPLPFDLPLVPYADDESIFIEAGHAQISSTTLKDKIPVKAETYFTTNQGISTQLNRQNTNSGLTSNHEPQSWRSERPRNASTSQQNQCYGSVLPRWLK